VIFVRSGGFRRLCGGQTVLCQAIVASQQKVARLRLELPTDGDQLIVCLPTPATHQIPPATQATRRVMNSPWLCSHAIPGQKATCHQMESASHACQEKRATGARWIVYHATKESSPTRAAARSVMSAPRDNTSPKSTA
jgi:hypothetical protein